MDAPLPGGEPAAPPRSDVVVDLPSPRRPVTAAILCFWLVGWAFGLAFMLQQLQVHRPFGGDELFLLLWMAAWTLAGVSAFVYMLWLVAGRERVLLEPGSLVIRHGVWGVWWTRRWPLASIRHLRPFGRGIPPVVALGLELAGRGASGVRFESGESVVRFARSLSETDARAVVDLLRARHDFGRETSGDAGGSSGSHSAA